jgi:hypothetical protein
MDTNEQANTKQQAATQEQAAPTPAAQPAGKPLTFEEKLLIVLLARKHAGSNEE